MKKIANGQKGLIIDIRPTAMIKGKTDLLIQAFYHFLPIQKLEVHSDRAH